MKSTSQSLVEQNLEKPSFGDLVIALSAAAMALGHRQWFIQSACATTGDGLYEARLGFDHDFVTTFWDILQFYLFKEL